MNSKLWAALVCWTMAAVLIGTIAYNLYGVLSGIAKLFPTV